MKPSLPPDTLEELRKHQTYAANRLYGPDMPPPELLRAAETITDWCARQGIRGYSIGGLMDVAYWERQWAWCDKTKRDVRHWQSKYHTSLLEIRALREKVKRLS